ncbi:ArsR/SmtB family transcription factor [Colwellia sp. Bg11-28]|uniref:ArsR/SmtB family transcription factor n=1 Tax=Colwellia sp. Bg11-28 TaxID=2058305 RepID=UPI0018E33909|nr:winged helix-turn-helix domain-containing protein [Colwellia sp. Bg11-28]
MEPNISFVANLIGDNTRSKMLTALMGGKALTASELALEADITSQTASSHLGKLVDGELLVVRKQGRHKYFQLKNGEIASLLEMLLNVSSTINNPKTKTGPSDPRLRQSRVCYDHLAGELGVVLYDSLVKNNRIIDSGCETKLTESGMQFFKEIGLNISELKKSKRPLCKSCLDWSERRNHLSGQVGYWILVDMYNQGWAIKDVDSRCILFTQKGLKQFKKTYQIISP